MAKNKSAFRSLGASLKIFSARLLIIFAGRWVRLLLVLLVVLTLLWLLLNRVWRPLQVELTLPPGVEQETPKLDLEKWGEIKDAQLEREAYSPIEWNNFQEYFRARRPDR